MQRRVTAKVLVMLAIAGTASACGGNNQATERERPASAPEAGGGREDGRRGGRLTFLTAGDVDYLDPGQTYYTVGYSVHYAVNRTLYSFRPEDPVRPVPDLASGQPEISADNKSVTVKIKRGVRYAPPVNREVTAADIKYAFERAFTKQVPSGYAGTYFGSLVGAPTEPNTGDYRPISGIETPDEQTLILRLKDTSAPLVSAALVMPITTPVPKEYAQRYDRRKPSTYDQYAAFTGPYMVSNDAQGKLVGRVPGRSIELIRNPNWSRATDYRPAYLDSIRLDEGNSDLTIAARRTLAGRGLVCCDSVQPPAAVLQQAARRARDQLKLVPAGGVQYIPINTRIEPFDNLNVRKAIIAASDREALRLTVGGPLVGEVASGWIPPSVPGFEEAGGPEQNTDLDFLANPKGDPAVARKYMLAAKREEPSLPITAAGRWTGPQRFLTVAGNDDAATRTAEVFQNQLGRLGFRLNLRLVPADTMFTKFLSVPRARVVFGPNAGWFRDFSDAQSMLDATFSGENILEQGNVNWPQLNVRAINQAMARAAAMPPGRERNLAWANVNQMIAQQAPAIPWLWPNAASLHSKDVNGVVNGYFGTHDFSFTSLK